MQLWIRDRRLAGAYRLPASSHEFVADWQTLNARGRAARRLEFEDLMARHVSSLRRLAMRWLPKTEDAEDGNGRAICTVVGVQEPCSVRGTGADVHLAQCDHC